MMRAQTKILGVAVDRINFSQAIDTILNFIESNSAHQVITANSLMIDSSLNDEELQKVFHQADLVIPDSIGIVLASKILGENLPEQIPGIDLMLKLCQISAEKKYKIFLLGSKEEVVIKAAKNLKNRYPGLTVAGYNHGYFTAEEETELIKKIRNLESQILFVGLAIPRQEKWINQHLKELNVPVVMGVGGSFDVISGILPRAPKLFRMLGCEWLFRFLCQPWRITRIIRLPLFLFRVVYEKLFVRKNEI